MSVFCLSTLNFTSWPCSLWPYHLILADHQTVLGQRPRSEESTMQSNRVAEGANNNPHRDSGLLYGSLEGGQEVQWCVVSALCPEALFDRHSAMVRCAMVWCGVVWCAVLCCRVEFSTAVCFLNLTSNYKQLPFIYNHTALDYCSETA